ncbi:uncharacterized protein EMH_0005600 [Eimeria mitis]|uniref:Vacuolar protein sorting protein 11 C-terminal domain-containing protein n=1 Tax=Eimeria mitis TaxID=44415 RepID=U6K2Y5_9EIME|nr:uncharacterized protein EMH_0005600 [Eimeria mitis]CDJ30133.1 hypothetical protein EMH_0005600 [Eimeria mitis]
MRNCGAAFFRKRLFSWAAEVAIQDQQPQQVLQEVYRLHGDWLFSKNMPERAVEMYIKTIGCAMQQHTLLFFKCTARLKDDSLLASFLEDPRISKTCSLTVALNGCRLNGDTELACTIASRHGYHDEHLSLLLETQNFRKAVEVLKQVDAPTACSLLLKHGSSLLRHSATDVFLLLSQFIKDYHTSVEVFIPLFVDDSDLLLLFLSSLVHGVTVARRLVPQHEALCNDLKLQEAIEEARIYEQIICGRSGKWRATHHPALDNTGVASCLSEERGCLQGKDSGGKVPDVSSLYTEILLKTLKSRPMRHRLLPALTVLEVLQQSPAVTLDAVKDYFLRASDDLSEQLEQSQALLQSDRAEVSLMAEEIERYKSKAQVFESERCDFCFLPIELPSIHFRCGHSFHIYCLSNNSDNKAGILQADGLSHESYCCAICTPQFNAKRLLLSQREAEACNTDDFFKFLRGSTDGFDFILSCFGRGLFPSRLKKIGLVTKDMTGLDPLIRSYACAGTNIVGDLLASLEPAELPLE